MHQLRKGCELLGSSCVLYCAEAYQVPAARSSLPFFLLQLGAGVDPDWMAQRSARTAATGVTASELGSELGSDEYSPRSSNASPSARR